MRSSEIRPIVAAVIIFGVTLCFGLAAWFFHIIDCAGF